MTKWYWHWMLSSITLNNIESSIRYSFSSSKEKQTNANKCKANRMEEMKWSDSVKCNALRSLDHSSIIQSQVVPKIHFNWCNRSERSPRHHYDLFSISCVAHWISVEHNKRKIELHILLLSIVFCFSAPAKYDNRLTLLLYGLQVKSKQRLH